jgi:hypothetical protein
LTETIGYFIKEGFHNDMAARLKTMPRNNRALALAPDKEEKIKAALEADPHALRVTRLLGDVSYATVWRVADRHEIPLTAGRETMGRPRLPVEILAKVEETVAANPEASQAQLARQTGVSRTTVRRVWHARRRAAPEPAG